MEQDPGVRDKVLEIKAEISQYDIDNPKGSVALILKDLKRLEMRMDDDFKIYAQDEIPASIEHEPADIISRRLALTAQRDALKKNAETRTILAGITVLEQGSDGDMC